MDRKYYKKSVDYAKELRRNMTKEEKHLWYDFLRDYTVKFKRQQPLGRYIADFYCAQANLVIELDGSRHFEDKGMSYDKEREKYLAGYGIKIVRIPNNEVWNNFEGVCLYIDDIVKEILKNT